MTAHPESIAPITGRLNLCASCDFVHRVQGRRGQAYLLCRNERIAAKYPPQPVLDCPGYVGKVAVSSATDADET